MIWMRCFADWICSSRNWLTRAYPLDLYVVRLESCDDVERPRRERRGRVLRVVVLDRLRVRLALHEADVVPVRDALHVVADLLEADVRAPHVQVVEEVHAVLLVSVTRAYARSRC